MILKQSKILKFGVALMSAAVLSLGSTASADTFTGGGDGVSWEDPANWSAGVVPPNNSTTILINGDYQVVYDSDTWDYLQNNGLAQSATQHRVLRMIINESTAAGAFGSNSITFDFAPNGEAREFLQTSSNLSVFGSRPGSDTVINLISGTVNTGSSAIYGGRNDSSGTLNISGGSYIVGRGSLQLGVNGDLVTDASTGIANISGGSFLTREGVAIGSTSTFRVIGSGATQIGIGSQGTVDGVWQQNAGATLSLEFDAGGVTPILIDEVDGDPALSNNGVATFVAGSVLETTDLGGFIQDVWVTVLSAEGGIVGAPTLSAASVAAGWESRITGNNLEVRLTGGGTPIKGDVDLSGAVDFADIPAFIGVLQSGNFQAEADCDCNGSVTFADIPAFIAILQGG